MKKYFLTLLAIGLLSACSTTPALHARDFNFAFSYGYGLHDNKLDSFHDTFTKDMVVDEPITVQLTLSDDELKTIEGKIAELDLFESRATAEPEGEIRSLVSPCEHYSLTVEYGTTGGGVTEWDCNNSTAHQTEFVNFMKTFIESQDEYQALPEREGGYM